MNAATEIRGDSSPAVGVNRVNRKLIGLIATATMLFLAHTVDHAMRDRLRWPSAELTGFLIVTLVVCGAIGTGLYLYAKGKVGPRFWTVFAFAGLAFGWAGHFSPFTPQPPSYILSAYGYSPAGWVALGVLIALMLVMGMAGAYAAYLSRRAAKGS